MAVQHTPVVIIPAPGQSQIEVVDQNGASVRDAWPISAEPEKVMKPLMGPLMKMTLFRKDGGFSDAAAKAIGKLADDLTSLPNGEPKYPLRVLRQDVPYAEYDEKKRETISRLIAIEELSQAVGEENIFVFTYHFFGSAYRSADELDAYIGGVLARTGAQQVDLLVYSLGGVLAESYLDVYAQKGEVRRILCADAALLGTHMISDILEGNLDLSDPEALFKKIGGSVADTFSGITEMMPQGVLQTTIQKVAAELAGRLLVRSSLMWGAVPADRYEELRDRFLCDPEQQPVRVQAEKLWAIHSDIRAFVRRVESCGARFFLLCGCGRRLFPIFGSGHVMSDGIVDAASSSMGAVCAPTGGELPETYAPFDPSVADAISPDRDVDASAGALPERTWFFDGQRHQELFYNDVAVKLICRILGDDTFDGVESDPAFPRFNGSRNIKKIKRDLYPRFAAVDRASLDEELGAAYDSAAEQYRVFSEKTIVSDDSETEDIEDVLTAVLNDME